MSENNERKRPDEQQPMGEITWLISFGMACATIVAVVWILWG